MVLEFILLGIGILGFGFSGYLDLKTTEFPDWLPYSIIISAIAVRGAFSISVNNLFFLINSIYVGAAFLALGLLLYYTKQWGDGDAWLLGAFGFLFPFEAVDLSFRLLPPPLILLFNFFLVSFVYLIIYSLGLGIKSGHLNKKFFKEFKKDVQLIVLLIAILAFIPVSFAYFSFTNAALPPNLSANLLWMPLLFVVLILFLKYGRYIEKNMFKRRIRVSRLRPGDVPVGKRWKVLSETEVKALKKKGGHIWIKEGVRFSPVFVITLVFTFFFGNLLIIFV